ncbi:hypothetical protein ACFVOK_13505 [Streptomyces sp. NPDC057798]|uniref:hypothetical protein n=1 Tax=Streptomyces sp. NPDC057798 TaxID=3346252 RepID=UPI003683FACF
MAALSEGFVSTVLALAETADIEASWQAVKRDERHHLKTASDPHAKEWTTALQQRSRELGRTSCACAS